MSSDLLGTRALVTGAAHGIGAAIAVALAEAGADVVVHYGRSAGAADTVARVEACGRKALAVQADLTSTEEAGRLVGEAVAFLGGLDVLVCNAGHLVGRSTVADMSDEQFAATLDVNLGATFRTCRAAVPHLGAKGLDAKGLGAKGRIITMSSLAAHNGGGPGSAAYAAAKAGVIGFTKALAKELAPQGITVNALAPGFIGQTAFHDTFTSAEARTAIVGGIPAGREGTPADVAAAAVYLAAPGNGFVTGTTLDIDGGVWPR
ncbi:SDR family NAD(P)-dependent oxidoreductase [Nonomuraea endophytica]|uniref:SDR family NAD(P)-dependent oxidoreductase n=1 Tax=Nonomuraea endophytica TaxID=714136 RepID=UPI0037C6CA7D